MAVFATFIPGNGLYQLTDTAVDGTSKVVISPFVRSSYNYLQGLGFTAIAAPKPTNNNKNVTITAYQNGTFTAAMATISLTQVTDPPADDATF